MDAELGDFLPRHGLDIARHEHDTDPKTLSFFDNYAMKVRVHRPHAYDCQMLAYGTETILLTNQKDACDLNDDGGKRVYRDHN